MDTETAGGDDRHGQLILAAEALSAWVHRQQAGWDEVPLVAAVPAIPLQSPRPSETWGDQTVLKVRVERHRTPVLVPTIAALFRTVHEAFVNYGRRIAIAIVVLAVVGSTGWAARSYWLTWAAMPKTGPATPVTVAAAGQSTPAPSNRHVRRTGHLHVESNPAGARVIIDGHARGVTPMTVDDLPVGSHVVVLESAAGSVRRSEAIEADRTTAMTESIFSGWLHVSAPIELQISEGGQAIDLDERSQALLAPGRHELRVENRALAYHSVRQVEIEPGKTASISIVPAPSTLTVIANAPGEVLVDGQRAGDMPLTNYPVNLGTREIVVRSTTGVTRRFTTTVTTAPVRLDVDFSKR